MGALTSRGIALHSRDGGDVLHFCRQGEVGQRAEDLGFHIAEILHEIAEDEFERVISLRTRADEV